MESHQEPKRFDTFRVPISLRSMVHGLMKHSTFEELGRGYYQWAATKIARSLFKFQDVHSIYLIGGGLTRCVPGVSDLDFVVLIDAFYEPEFLNQFRKVVKNTRFRYPVLGEVHVLNRAGWKRFSESHHASLHWFRGRHKFMHEGWEKDEPLFRQPPKEESQLALSLWHYWKAHGFLIRSMKEYPDYFLAHFQREISKAIDFVSGSSLQIRRGLSYSSLLLTALEKIEESAESLLSDRRGNAQLKLVVKEKGGERFAIEVQQSRWFDQLRSSGIKGFEISKTPIPGVMGLDLDEATNNPEDLIRSFYASLSGFTSPPLLLGPAGIEVIRRGLGWGAPGEHLNWLSPSDLEDSDLMSSIAYFSHTAIRERLLLSVTFFRGKIVSASMEQLHKLFEEVYFCYQTIQSSRMTNDDAALLSEMKKAFPNLPSRKKSDYLQALREIESFLNLSPNRSGLN